MLLPSFRSVAVSLVVFLGIAGAVEAQAPVSSHEKAARELYQMIGGAKLAESGAEAMMGVVSQNPELAGYEDVFRAWYKKVFSSGDLESEVVKLYMGAFSEQELRELAAFYKTPIGVKALATFPTLMQQGAEIGMRRAQEHSAELEEMLAAAKRERGLTGGDAQKQTIADIRNTGTAMFSWLTDQVSAAAAGQSQTETKNTAHLQQYVPISHAELEKILVPVYINAIPETDGWGHPYEFYLNIADPMVEQVMAIRSPGRDGEFSADDYDASSFTPNDLDQDIVWADGFFIRWPEAPQK